MMAAMGAVAPGQRRRRRRPACRGGFIARLLAARSGATGLEFALTGPLFLLMVFAILEVGLDSFTQAQLDDSVRDAARQLQIGNVTTAAQVVTTVCIKLSVVVPNCAANVSVYAASGTTFAALPVATVKTSGGLTPATFTPGTASSDMLLQVGFTRSFVLPYFGGLVGGNFTNTLISSIAFQNEAY
jgi:Flp pilus assembly protein TadG